MVRRFYSVADLVVLSELMEDEPAGNPGKSAAKLSDKLINLITAQSPTIAGRAGGRGSIFSALDGKALIVTQSPGDP